MDPVTRALKMHCRPHIAPPVVKMDNQDKLFRIFELYKERGTSTWRLKDLKAGKETGFGLAGKEEAIRRAAAIIQRTGEPASLRLFSIHGKLQTVRYYNRK